PKPVPVVASAPSRKAQPESSESSSEDEEEVQEVPPPPKVEKSSRTPAPTPKRRVPAEPAPDSEHSGDEAAKPAPARKGRKQAAPAPTGPVDPKLANQVKRRRKGAAADEEPAPPKGPVWFYLTSQEVRERKEVMTPVQYELLKYESKQDPTTWLPYNLDGHCKSKTGMSVALADKITYAMNTQYPIELYTGPLGMYPVSVPDQKKICSDAFTNALKEDNDKIPKIMTRYSSEAKFRKVVTELIHDRRHQARGKVMIMGRHALFALFGLAPFDNQPLILQNAVNELLRGSNFLYPGKLEIQNNRKSFKYVISTEDRSRDYCGGSIVQMTAMSFFGHASIVRDRKNRGVPGFDFDASVFPEASFVRRDADPDQPKPREMPIAMLAFVAASIEHALNEWDHGTYRDIPLVDANIKRPYDRHLRDLNKKKPRARSLLLQYVYKLAREWTPPTIEITDDERPEIGTSEAEDLYPA
ncbi:unnamed protein product, partial [Peniophora sp. CBMAI 1063]